ncbi:hypothetical protein AADG42_08330 [Ammonicoccus fulvus]|uniref:Uncharacterized protein n=1 Tax=Ammonicoccus fulvus TaxID=3138240 RepID=A0ABZ3FRC1_9ACTN
MNYLLTVRDWGTLHVVCQHPSDGETIATIDAIPTTGEPATLTPDKADKVARELLTKADKVARGKLSADALTVADTPVLLAIVPDMVRKLHRAAALARAAERPPLGPHPFVIA